jgi:hypothetical protein
VAKHSGSTTVTIQQSTTNHATVGSPAEETIMNINHLDIAAAAIIEHERRLSAAGQARLINQAEGVTLRRKRRSMLTLRRNRRPALVETGLVASEPEIAPAWSIARP